MAITIATERVKGGTIPGPVTFALSDLTTSDDTGAQLVYSPAWWDPDSGGAKLRTNMTMAPMEVEVGGTKSFGVIFSDPGYSSTNAIGEPHNVRVGYIAWRSSTDSGANWSGWACGVRPVLGHRETILSRTLDASSTYRIQWQATHVGDSDNMTSRMEQFRESDGTERAIFWQVEGFKADAGATFATVTHDAEALNVLVMSNSNSTGYTTSTGAPDTVTAFNLTEHNNVAPDYRVTTPATMDHRGALVGYMHALTDTYAESAGKRVRRINQSFNGGWMTRMGTGATGLRTVLPAGPFPGLQPDRIDAFDKLIEDREFPASFSPDVVMINIGGDKANATLQVAHEGLGPYSGRHTGAHARADIIELVTAIRAKWPATKVMLIEFWVSDATVDALIAALPAAPTVDTGAQIIAALTDGTDFTGSGPTAADDGGADAAWLATWSLVGVAGLPTTFDLHLNAAEHEIARASVQDEFNDLMGR